MHSLMVVISEPTETARLNIKSDKATGANIGEGQQIKEHTESVYQEVLSGLEIQVGIVII